MLRSGKYTRRYLVYPMYIDKKIPLDKAMSLIISDDRLLGVPDEIITEIINSFESFLEYKFRVYEPEYAIQLDLFEDKYL